MRSIKHPFKPDDAASIQDVLKNRSGIIVYPTETFYAVGCAADDSVAVKKIYRLKKRALQSPLLVLIDSWETAYEFIDFKNSEEIEFLRQYWPGPLTAVLRTKPVLAPELNPAGPAVGFRMTTARAARDIINLIGAPIVGTSANVTNEKETTMVEFARQSFQQGVDLYIDGGQTPGEAPSTVIDMTRGRPYPLIRKGKLTFDKADTNIVLA